MSAPSAFSSIRSTGAAFLVIDTLRLRAGNPYPYHRETVIVRRDSGTAPPRELDLCIYADSAETVLAHEEDSLYVASGRRLGRPLP